MLLVVIRAYTLPGSRKYVKQWSFGPCVRVVGDLSIYVYIYIYIYSCAYIYICLEMYIYECLCTDLYIYTYKYIHIYICRYLHIVGHAFFGGGSPGRAMLGSSHRPQHGSWLLLGAPRRPHKP